jgi:MFS family permease
MTAINNPSSSSPTEMGTSNEKGLAENVVDRGVHADDESDGNSELKQAGVKQVEAVTQAWSPAMMWLVFVLFVQWANNNTQQSLTPHCSLYLVTFVDTLLQAVHSGLVAYVTSSFSQHGLLAVTSIFGSVVAGVGKLAIAKLIDIRGRCEGFLLMILFIIIGMILKALCENVETYAAGHTFYWVGHIGLSYIINVIVSDMTSLRNRMIIWGLYMSPRLASTFGGPKIAELFYEHSTYRWAFGSFTIILVGFSIPVAVVLIMNERKAKIMGLLRKEKSGRSLRESTIHYLVEFDGKLLFSSIHVFSTRLTLL